MAVLLTIWTHALYNFAASAFGEVVAFGCVVSLALLIVELIWYRLKKDRGGKES